MGFEVLGDVWDIQVVARGRGIRERRRLLRAYGPGHWRKLKGFAMIRLDRATVHVAEIHWYEADGVGRREFKIKRIVR